MSKRVIWEWVADAIGALCVIALPVALNFIAFGLGY